MPLTNLILISWYLSIGFIPASSLEIGEDTVLRYNNSFVQTIGINFNIAQTVNLFTEVEIRDTKTYAIYFDPYRADFIIGMETCYKDFKLGVTHECNHDIVTDIKFNKYNGLDGAWMNIYFNWNKEFKMSDDVSLAPVLRMGFRPYDNVYIKPVTGDVEDYFGHDFLKGSYNYTLFGKAETGIDIYEYLHANIGFQPEYSFEYDNWGIHGNIGIEGRYRKLALGINWKMQKRFKNTGYAANELMLYLSFRGKTSLF